MICKTCGSAFWKTCRHCEERRDLLRAEAGYLRTWSAGNIELRLRDFKGVLHLELFSDRWQSYCGVALFVLKGVVCPPLTRSRARELPREACADCRKIFNELVAKAGKEGRHAR